MRRRQILVSCEHGGNLVPELYAPLFAGAAEVLDSHRGMDFGALDVASTLGKRLGVTPITATTTRLVVDLNRSPNHRNVFSEYTRDLTPAQRAQVLAEHYWPYRKAVESAVGRAVDAGAAVLHVSSHSFTPALNGDVRNCDVAFLYDPARRGERNFIEAWHDALRAAAPELKLRRNYPYRGTADALVTHLRKLHADGAYAGVEIEVNQKHVGSANWRDLVGTLAAALSTTVAGLGPG
jgi:predicted N-formylglutamate amidohydrolase